MTLKTFLYKNIDNILVRKLSDIKNNIRVPTINLPNNGHNSNEYERKYSFCATLSILPSIRRRVDRTTQPCDWPEVDIFVERSDENQRPRQKYLIPSLGARDHCVHKTKSRRATLHVFFSSIVSICFWILSFQFVLCALYKSEFH